MLIMYLIIYIADKEWRMIYQYMNTQAEYDDIYD